MPEICSITDVIMPGLSGPQLVHCIAPKRPNMKVLYFSNHSEQLIQSQQLIDEGSAFLQKPASINDLLKKIRELLS